MALPDSRPCIPALLLFLQVFPSVSAISFAPFGLEVRRIVPLPFLSLARQLFCLFFKHIFFFLFCYLLLHSLRIFLNYTKCLRFPLSGFSRGLSYLALYMSSHFFATCFRSPLLSRILSLSLFLLSFLLDNSRLLSLPTRGSPSIGFSTFRLLLIAVGSTPLTSVGRAISSSTSYDNLVRDFFHGRVDFCDS